MTDQHLMDIKPIPAFYCCYLLRSTIRHANLYVGSTPNPRRRLAQHNGNATGGAVRTSRESLRPWEMTCVVVGFPSNIAALQFEWAWQNSHLTRHIQHHDRLSFTKDCKKLSLKTGKSRQRPKKPSSSLSSSLGNLHLLLRSPYFSKWPLELRFFSDDVYQFWETWCQRTDCHIPSKIKVWLDTSRHDQGPSSSTGNSTARNMQSPEMRNIGGLTSIDPTYRPWRPVIEKADWLLTEDELLRCSLCKQNLDIRRSPVTMCPRNDCESVHHMTCLSSHFLETDSESSLLPTSGRCPCCKTLLQWSDLMMDLTLRMRGKDEIQKVLNRRSFRTPRIPGAAVQCLEESDDLNDSDDNKEPPIAADLAEEEDEDCGSVTSIESNMSHTSARRTVSKTAIDRKLPTVIEDSDTDSSDLLKDWNVRVGLKEVDHTAWEGLGRHLIP